MSNQQSLEESLPSIPKQTFDPFVASLQPKPKADNTESTNKKSRFTHVAPPSGAGESKEIPVTQSAPVSQEKKPVKEENSKSQDPATSLFERTPSLSKKVGEEDDDDPTEAESELEGFPASPAALSPRQMLLISQTETVHSSALEQSSIASQEERTVVEGKTSRSGSLVSSTSGGSMKKTVSRDTKRSNAIEPIDTAPSPEKDVSKALLESFTVSPEPFKKAPSPPSVPDAEEPNQEVTPLQSARKGSAASIELRQFVSQNRIGQKMIKRGKDISELISQEVFFSQGS